jgi:hypothetical protein
MREGVKIEHLVVTSIMIRSDHDLV